MRWLLAALIAMETAVVAADFGWIDVNGIAMAKVIR
jgi:hypothetical protein